jgi:hypothetical protein
MTKLTHESLYSLEQYARMRPEFRAKIIEHKKSRRAPIGEHAVLYFEDELTMKYQVQEMLRIERIFGPDEIENELNVYNPLIPDGMNWKATFMMEYADVEERKAALAKLIGIERALWIQIAGFDKVRPIANEDLVRETETKTSSVHFVRFELTPEMAAAAKKAAQIKAGIDHPSYTAEVSLADNVRQSLAGDLH